MRRSLATLVALVVFALADAAHAEPSAADRASARAMLDDGYALLDKGDAKSALKLFLAADATMNVPTTALAVARAEGASGMLLEAHEKLVSLLREPRQPGEPAAFTRARDEAALFFKDVDARVPVVRIEVTGASRDDIAIVLDDEKLPREANSAPRRVNPGHHVIIVEEAGKEAARRDVDLAERQQRAIVIHLTHAEQEHEQRDPNTQHDPHAQHDSREHGSYALTYAGFGVGVAGIGVGTVTGILAIAKKGSSDIVNNCVGDRCSPAANDAVYQAKTFATTSTIAFIVGGVGVGVGVVGLFVGGGSSASARVSAMPYVGVNEVGVRGRF